MGGELGPGGVGEGVWSDLAWLRIGVISCAILCLELCCNIAQLGPQTSIYPVEMTTAHVGRLCDLVAGPVGGQEHVHGPPRPAQG